MTILEELASDTEEMTVTFNWLSRALGIVPSIVLSHCLHIQHEYIQRRGRENFEVVMTVAAYHLGISHSTVKRAFKHLMECGLIMKVEQRDPYEGCFVINKRVLHAMRQKSKKENSRQVSA